MGNEIVDACCMINLYSAVDDLGPLLRAIGSRFHVPRTVAEEALYVLRPHEEDAHRTVQERIDLSPLIEAQLLRICDLQSVQENALYVRFAADLDDGEAACLAIAQSRGWRVATDDRKAQRLATESGIAVVATPELIRRWCDAEGFGGAKIGEVLRRIRDYARFVPRRGSVLADWWMDRLGE
ncbi:MAG: hypothetical protein A2V70_19280 [Planctomycetes bacterium RBG_13_63_9]|nr:MAG: hypothetical protein A2V70_19280 [Planctomycetes bacterium RBG_13_63_9]